MAPLLSPRTVSPSKLITNKDGKGPRGRVLLHIMKHLISNSKILPVVPPQMKLDCVYQCWHMFQTQLTGKVFK